jgi:hypothetical protein
MLPTLEICKGLQSLEMDEIKFLRCYARQFKTAAQIIWIEIYESVIVVDPSALYMKYEDA